MEEEKQVLINEDVQEEAAEIIDHEDVQKEDAEVINYEDKRFGMTMEVRDASLRMAMEGRLDTTTADGMMDKYKEEAEKRTFTEVVIDMEKLDYLSSAGLRVLLMIRKHLAGGGSFHVVNVNSVIREIMENTGFDEILL